MAIKKSAELNVPTTIKCLIYGQAGVGKTTLALSAPAPLLVDFDGGVKRVHYAHTPDTICPNSWQEALDDLFQSDLSEYKTIVVDTIGKMMDFIITHKCGNRQPQLRDWAGINAEFNTFVRNLSNLGKNIIFVAHRDVRKEGDDNVYIPALRDKNYSAIITELDLLGYVEMRTTNGRTTRSITFDPTARNDGKNTCYLPSVMEIPTVIQGGNIVADNNFMASAVMASYLNMLQQKQQLHTEYIELLKEIEVAVAAIDDAEKANAFVKGITEYKHIGSSLIKARELFAQRVNELGLTYNKEEKCYV